MKKIILISIVVIGFGGAIVMAILAMTAGDSAEPSIIETTDSTGAPIAPLSAILPEGKSLDFSKVEDFNKDGLLFPFPKVSPQEIGATLGTIIE